MATRYRQVADPSVLVGHFRLSKNRPALDGWPRATAGGWYLDVEPSLPVREVAVGSETVGWMLGYPVAADGGLADPRIQLSSAGEEAEEQIFAFSGRFVAILVKVGRPRVYLDPLGTYGVLYSPDTETVSSSTFLVSDVPDDRIDLLEAVGMPGKEFIFPFGLTGRKNVDFLMPNHFLDLKTFTIERHWPKGPITREAEGDGPVAEILHRLQKNISAVAKAGPLQMSLTAGRDSRMLLAAARDLVEDITLITFAIDDAVGRPDANIAPRIARTLGLRHRLLAAETPSRHDMDLFVYRTSCQVDEPRGVRLLRPMSRLDPAQPYLMGVGGELGRESYWLPGDSEDMEFGVEELLRHKKIPPLPEIVDRAEAWLDGLPQVDPLLALDLFQIERGFGGWSGFLMYGFPDAGSYQFMPYSDRALLHAMARLPANFRVEQRLPEKIFELAWPELADFPYNEVAFGWHGAYQQLRKTARKLLKGR